MLLPSSKRLVPQSWNILNGMFQTKRKAETKLNIFEYSDSKRYLAELLEYEGKGYIVLHAVCPACRSDTFGTVLPFCIQQNILTMNGRHFPFNN
jgi:hypothetical protein